MKRVYIAGPYSASTMGGRLENVARAVDVGIELYKLGYAPFIPHLTYFTDPGDQEGIDWYATDMKWVEVSDCVLRLDGYSPGATREVDHAKSRGIPVYFDIESLDLAERETCAFK